MLTSGVLVAKKLKWLNLEYGLMPDCVRCTRMLIDPLFVEAVYSVSIDKTGSPEKLKIAALEAYHEQGHKH